MNWLVANTRPDITIYKLDLTEKQKKATLRDLREVNKILRIVLEKESNVVFKKVSWKEELCVVGVWDASYHNDERSMAGEIKIFRNKSMERASPLY